ncbi:MAG: hypothetical protein ACYDH2_10190 [Anaerolineaceae bacterium]
MFSLGECYRIETNLDREGQIKSHFYVIILKTEKDQIVMVNFDKTRGRSKYDRTVIIMPGECGDIITEESYINYNEAELIDIESFQTKVETGIIKFRGVIGTPILDRINNGVLRSKHTPFEIREIYEDKIYGSL